MISDTGFFSMCKDCTVYSVTIYFCYKNAIRDYFPGTCDSLEYIVMLDPQTSGPI